MSDEKKKLNVPVILIAVIGGGMLLLGCLGCLGLFILPAGFSRSTGPPTALPAIVIEKELVPDEPPPSDGEEAVGEPAEEPIEAADEPPAND